MACEPVSRRDERGQRFARRPADASEAEARRTRVVELSGLTDRKTARADDHDALDVGLGQLGQDLGRDAPGELGRRVEGRFAVSRGVVVADGRGCDRAEGERRPESPTGGRRGRERPGRLQRGRRAGGSDELAEHGGEEDGRRRAGFGVRRGGDEGLEKSRQGCARGQPKDCSGGKLARRCLNMTGEEADRQRAKEARKGEGGGRAKATVRGRGRVRARKGRASGWAIRARISSSTVVAAGDERRRQEARTVVTGAGRVQHAHDVLWAETEVGRKLRDGIQGCRGSCWSVVAGRAGREKRARPRKSSEGKRGSRRRAARRRTRKRRSTRARWTVTSHGEAGSGSGRPRGRCLFASPSSYCENKRSRIAKGREVGALYDAGGGQRPHARTRSGLARSNDRPREQRRRAHKSASRVFGGRKASGDFSERREGASGMGRVKASTRPTATAAMPSSVRRGPTPGQTS